ncbi:MULTISPECIES: hypothetical protein [Rhodococcus]|uniref:hypothetical protein n=1 Tax=Rhodococcus TaxID=1827 RepID=UPI001F13AB3E|nr:MULTISPECIES: hypothetical protein [Rhodococcus]MCJ0950609.1 hypothetical protein [Rhodococcus sp. ARC_M8]MCQ4152598.1 hypothetical protein [Rhodococcus qingshengii]ULD45004.1 hypothetical protein JKI97_31710 [Rhodococcus qingshengii]
MKAVGLAYAAYRSIVESATDSEDAKSIASDLTVGRGPIRVPQRREKFAHNIAEHRESDLDVDAKAVDAKAGNEDAIADFAEPFFVDEMTNEGLDEILDPQDAATEPARRDIEGTQGETEAGIDDLMAFIAGSDLAKNVKDTAVRKLTNPNLTWETIALESKPPVATSTAWRRYEKFDTAAREAGFDSPPLPDLRAAENPMRSELTTV